MDGTRREFLRVFAASSGLLTGTFSTHLLFAADKLPLRILFYGGSIPSVEAALMGKVELEVLRAGQDPKKQGDEKDNVIGLEQLEKADLWIGSGNKRNFPSEAQLKHFREYLARGGSFVGYRAASHIFQNWLEVDQAVWGAKYGGHHLLNKDPELIVEYEEGAKDHPILAGLTAPAPSSGSYFYRDRSPDVEVLLYSGLKGDMQPHTWTRTIKKTGNRVFYTRYDAKQIANEAVCREIFLRGIAWALGDQWSQALKT